MYKKGKDGKFTKLAGKKPVNKKADPSQALEAKITELQGALKDRDATIEVLKKAVADRDAELAKLQPKA